MNDLINEQAVEEVMLAALDMQQPPIRLRRQSADDAKEQQAIGALREAHMLLTSKRDGIDLALRVIARMIEERSRPEATKEDQ